MARNPTRREMGVIQKWSLNPKNWLVRKHPPGKIYLEHRHTRTRRAIKERRGRV